MKIIEPKKADIFNELRKNGCCWLGCHGCECHRKCNWNMCFEDAKKYLTKTEYTQEEIKEFQKRNEKAMKEIDKAISFMFE